MPGEDEATNPGCFGKDLATWLGDALKLHGYGIEIIAEDWGWCIMCARDPFTLWIGCSNTPREQVTLQRSSLIAANDTVWTCFVAVQAPLLKRLFTRADTASAANKLFAEMQSVLHDDAKVMFVQEP